MISRILTDWLPIILPGWHGIPISCRPLQDTGKAKTKPFEQHCWHYEASSTSLSTHILNVNLLYDQNIFGTILSSSTHRNPPRSEFFIICQVCQVTSSQRSGRRYVFLRAEILCQQGSKCKVEPYSKLFHFSTDYSSELGSPIHRQFRDAHEGHRPHAGLDPSRASTGVVWCTERANEHGFSDEPHNWFNLGQGAPQADDGIEGSFPRPKTIEISENAREYGPTAGIKPLRVAIADLYNAHHRQGKASKYS